ncbi:MAG TPA: DUF4012 domain-containing protein, partial [Candidatus Limnocylindrales bacterium]|nr:DUF4012 domain-containing protein [Candidatus Limnocylindrales bacterium]
MPDSHQAAMRPPVASSGPAHGPASSRGKARRRALVVLGVLVVLLAVGVLAGFQALAAKDRMQEGRDHLTEAADRIGQGDLDGAVAAFDRAKAAFERAKEDATRPVLRALGIVPLAGRTVDATVTLAAAGGLAADAGLTLSETIAELPGGIAALAPSEGRLPVETIGSLQPTISDARRSMDEALARVEALPTSFIAGPVADARDEALDELERAATAVRRVDAVARFLPALAGAEGERRYFVAAQSNAELRGTGGFIGSWTILEASDGHLTMEPMRNITDLRDVRPGDLASVPPNYNEVFGISGGPGYWRNINADPDV